MTKGSTTKRIFMQTINDQIPASGVLPDDYQEVLSWKVTGKPMRVIALNIFNSYPLWDDLFQFGYQPGKIAIGR
jgi:hypothetical protein